MAPAPHGPIVAVGELLWDLLPDGPQLGGAPCNVAAHLHRLGHTAVIVSAVGRDDLGRRARFEVEKLGVDATWLQKTNAAPTGTAGVVLDVAGSPSFRIAEPAAYQHLRPDSPALETLAATRPAAIVFGTLAQRSPSMRSTTRALAAACPRAIRLYDVNLREGCWDLPLVAGLLGEATVIKLSEHELPVALRAAGVAPGSGASALAVLAAATGALAVCVTRGGSGASLWIDGALLGGPPPVVEVVDAVGAGDAFAAALLDGLISGRSADETLRRALALGSLVAARPGAVPAWTARELAALVARTPMPSLEAGSD